MSLGTLLATIFYGAMFVALGYFLHKLVWFVQLRRVQGELVREAVERLEGVTEASMSTWERRADASWLGAPRRTSDASPYRYAERIEENLESVRETIVSSAQAIGDRFVQALHTRLPEDEIECTILTLPRIEGAPRNIRLSMGFPLVRRPKPPDDALYELEVRSRYGLVPRLLAFLLGAADVVYSSQHLARISHNTQVPIGVILRRLSLVALILWVVILDIAFGARAWLIEEVARELEGVELGWTSELGSLIAQNLPTLLALGIWLAAYGGLYLGLYLFLRHRSQIQLRRLRQMRETSTEQIEGIFAQHVESLLDWGQEYGRALDDQIRIAVRQSEMLLDLTIDSLRRRLANPRLIELANGIREDLFRRLPESSRKLQDELTTGKHSLRHYLWPRESEMRHQVQIAQYRAAWGELSMAMTELRGARPAPALAMRLWRSLVRYTSMFPEIFGAEIREALHRAYSEITAGVVDATDRDLLMLDTRLDELGRSLEEKLAVTRSLVLSQIGLTERAIEADVATLSAEILRLREQARLEAMAFEI
ncbi:MAG: hypothetical protein OEY14_04860 [Myxococcales bacterium]|nr:hypothetical protein [Myxococcales bacterium]